MLLRGARRWLWGLGGIGLAAAVAAYVVINYGWRWLPPAAVKLARQPDLLENPKPERCGECHREIFAAWKKSGHARAWVSEIFVEDSENRAKEKCYPCHIPARVTAGVKPEPRLWHRDSGVYCVPCHGREDTINGPYELFSPPHPTARSADYRAPDFCAVCHQKTYKEWEQSGSRKTCQDCHMPRAAGRLTQKFPLSLLHAPREVADHGAPAGLTAGLEVKYAWTPDALRVELLNGSVPHLLPTADSGDPRFYLQVELRDGNGAVVGQHKEIFAPQQETALPFGRAAGFVYPAPPEAAQAAITVARKPAWTKEKTEIKRLQAPRG